MLVFDVIRAVVVRANALAQRGAFVAPLLARLTVGFAFAESGWGKLQHLDSVAAYFAELGIPSPVFQATFVSFVELTGGTLVLVGLATRAAAIPLIATMVVAILTAKASEITGFSSLIGTIEFCYAVLLTWLALAGPGAASIDRAIARRGSTTRAANPALPEPLF